MVARVAVIGPTNLPKIAAASGIPLACYERLAASVGTLLGRLQLELVVVPDRGIAILALEAYRAAGGRKVIGLVPEGGESDPVATDNCLAHMSQCDELLTGFTWPEQHAVLCRVSQALVCVGLSCGTMAEIVWTKWIPGRQVFVLRPTVTGLPPEILAEARVRLVDDPQDLYEALASWRSVLDEPGTLDPRPTTAANEGGCAWPFPSASRSMGNG